MTAPRIFTPEYYDHMRALEAGGWWNAGMRDAAAGLLRHGALPACGRLLDVGCGSGQTMTWFLSQHPEWDAVGLDVARDGLAAARALGLKVLSGASALALPYADRSFDLVVSLDVLQHLPLVGGDAAALAETWRVLKPGGLLLVRTNAQAFPHTPDDPVAMFHKYQPAELRQKFRAAGFEVLRLSRINAFLGLAEIPRELRARRRDGNRYHGILSQTSVRKRGASDSFKRWWLHFEGRAVRMGIRLPLGRTLLALAARPAAGRDER